MLDDQFLRSNGTPPLFPFHASLLSLCDLRATIQWRRHHALLGVFSLIVLSFLLGLAERPSPGTPAAHLLVPRPSVSAALCLGLSRVVRPDKGPLLVAAAVFLAPMAGGTHHGTQTAAAAAQVGRPDRLEVRLLPALQTPAKLASWKLSRAHFPRSHAGEGVGGVPAWYTHHQSEELTRTSNTFRQLQSLGRCVFMLMVGYVDALLLSYHFSHINSSPTSHTFVEGNHGMQL